MTKIWHCMWHWQQAVQLTCHHFLTPLPASVRLPRQYYLHPLAPPACPVWGRGWHEGISSFQADRNGRPQKVTFSQQENGVRDLPPKNALDKGEGNKIVSLSLLLSLPLSLPLSSPHSGYFLSLSFHSFLYYSTVVHLLLLLLMYLWQTCTNTHFSLSQTLQSILQNFVDELFNSLFSITHTPSSPIAASFPQSPIAQVSWGVQYSDSGGCVSLRAQRLLAYRKFPVFEFSCHLINFHVIKVLASKKWLTLKFL